MGLGREEVITSDDLCVAWMTWNDAPR